MKKSDTVALALVGLLLGGVVASVALCYRYVRTLSYAHTLQLQGQKLQGQLAVATRNREVVRAMVADALEYSKKNPAVDPVLQQLELKPNPAAPAAKPSPR